jgi:hypothetical protein
MSLATISSTALPQKSSDKNWRGMPMSVFEVPGARLFYEAKTGDLA